MTRQMDRYLAYLESDHWKQLRQRKFAESGRVCQHCQGEQEIRVHHIRYHNLTDVEPSDLLVLCAPCHDLLHVAIKAAKSKVEEFDLEESINVVNWFKATTDFEERRARIEEDMQERRRKSLDRTPMARGPRKGKRKGKSARRAINKAFRNIQARGFDPVLVREFIQKLEDFIKARENDSVSQHF